MTNSIDLFDSDMIETSLVNYNPMRGLKNKIPFVDKYRPKKLDEIVQQEEAIKVLKECLKTGKIPHILLFGPPGTGKCLSKGTQVIMYDGSVKLVENIKQNDKLMGDNNTPRTVLGTTSGEDVMYRIIQGKGDDYDVNSEHIISLRLSIPFVEKWLEKEGRYKLLWFEDHKGKQKSFTVRKIKKPLKKKKIIKNKNSSVLYNSKGDAHIALKNFKQNLITNNISNKEGDICDISVKEYIKKPVDWRHAYKGFKCERITCWPKQEVDLDPYMLGYWLGDGDKKGAHITTADSEIVEEFQEKIKIYDLKLKEGNNTEKYKGEYQYFITTGDCINEENNKWSNNCNSENYFFQQLKKYHLIENKHVPNNYKINDVGTRLQLLGGFLDGGGYLGETSNIFEFSQKSKKLFDDMIFVARSLGLIGSVGKSKIIDGVEYHRANIYGEGIEDIPTKIARKESEEYHHNKDPLVYEIQVRELDKGKYYGFELDGNGRFLLGDFTVTHNTSSILSFAMELFGPKIFDRRVIELNASDERGINVVRNKIITFAKSAVGNPDPNYPCPPYKIIILDEADAMTMEAQSALRTVMESLSNITRFCFICNYINQIIDPIASRCMKFRFKSIGNETMTNKLLDIAKKENFAISNDVLKNIVELAKGDIRSGIITLQYIKYIYDYQGCISVKDIYETTNYLPTYVIKGVWARCIEGKRVTISDVKREALYLKQKGYSINCVLDKLNQVIVGSNHLNDNEKSLIVLNIAKTEKRLIDGSDEYIQLLNVLAYIQGIFKNKIKFEKI